MTLYSTSNSSSIEVTGDTAPSTATGRQPPRPTAHNTGLGATNVPMPTGSSTDAIPPAIRANWGRIARARLSERMYESILRIATAREEVRAPALAPISLAQFLEFWRKVGTDAVEPELVLASDGTIHAEWFRSARQRLDVRFTTGGKAIFGLFATTGVLEGADSADAVATWLAMHPARPLRWSPR
jgi:hypothetical protein